MVSREKYEVWYAPGEAHRRSLLKRRVETPFLVVRQTGAAPVAALRTLEGVLAWHDANVISPGWLVLPRPTSEWEELGLGDVGNALRPRRSR